MNLFRLTGDFLHLLAIAILIFKICKSKSCAGISARSQIIFAALFVCRYSDLFTNFISFYITCMKILLVFASFLTLFLILVKFNKTYDRQNDAFRIEFLCLPCVGLALVINHDFTVMEILWTFSVYLETVAIVPQMWMLIKIRDIERGTCLYLYALGSYKFMYILNWIYRYNREYFYDPIAIGAAIIQTLIYALFFCIGLAKLELYIANVQKCFVLVLSNGNADKIVEGEKVESGFADGNQSLPSSGIITKSSTESEILKLAVEPLNPDNLLVIDR